MVSIRWFGVVRICEVAGDVSTGGAVGGLLVLLVCKRMKTNIVKMSILQLSTP